jgi:hypothetical protein
VTPQNEKLSAAEFVRAMDRLHDRFDSVDRKLDEYGERIAVVEASTKRTKAKSATWSAAIAGAIALLFEGVRAYLTR